MKAGRAVIVGIVIFILLCFIGSKIIITVEDSQSSKKEEVLPLDEELRGLWVTTAYCLDFPSSPNLSEEELKKELNIIVENTKNWGLNAIFFQVRPCSDSFYKSQIYPVSEFLSTDHSLPNSFDPLEYLVELGKENNIQIHAWINPLRVTTGSIEEPSWNLDTLPENHPAKNNKDLTVAYADGKLYYDIGLPEVRELIINGVIEIIENYDVSGIHFDDYFYPYPIENAKFNDSYSYEQYANGKPLDEYRRNNVNLMVRDVYNAIKEYDSSIVFGISPQGIWANNETDQRGSNTGPSIESYSDLYADSLYWMEQGIVDYICPQIYWSFEQDGVEFNVVYDWWARKARDTNIKLYAGLAAYKVGMEEFGWDKEGEIKNQINYCRESYNNGFILFRYKFLLNNKLNLTSSW